MRALYILLMLVLCSTALSGQTYCYVSALEVIPDMPTTEDEVSVHVIGDFASTGSFITGHSVEIGIGTVALTIDCADPGGFTVITPFDTTLVIGTGLLAGDYTIELGGEGLGDFVTDPADYDFTVTGLNGLEEPVEALVTWTIDGEQLQISNGWHEQVRLTIYDIQGRLLLEPQAIAAGTQRLVLLDIKGPVLLSFEADGIVWVAQILRQQ